jgi:signal transduction histidine kinase
MERSSIDRWSDFRFDMRQGWCVQRRELPPVRDAALALAFVGAGLFEVWAIGLEPYWVSVPSILVQGGAVAWRQRAPLVALVTATVAMFVGTAAGVPLHAAIVPIAIALVLVYSVGQHEPRSRAAFGLVVVLCGVHGAMQLAVANGEDYPIGDRVFVTLFVVAPWLVGRALHGRAREVEELADRAARLERERQAALAEERARIARELHDVIAHSLGVIVVQAGAGETVAVKQPEHAREVLHSIQQLGRQSLGEMSRLVGVLRDGGEEVGLAPQPGLVDLPALVAQTRASGLDATFSVTGTPVDVAPGLDVAAYRIVQEALTNTRKHASATLATVTVHHTPEELTIEILDDGTGSANGSGGGHGIIGMRERAALYGGTFEAGPRPDRGYAVRAVLPIEDGRA